ncbi:antigen identified by monoclonal antibody Ki-67 [Balamuthia mandrillaris]
MSAIAMPKPKYGMLTALRRDGRPGKQMPLLSSVITFGSWEKCAVVLKGQEFIPQHVKLDFTDQPTIHNLSNEASPSVSLNDVPLGYQYPKPLKHGDIIKFSNGAKFRFDPVVPLVLDITKEEDEGSIGASKAQTNNRSTKAVAATKRGNSPTEESNKEKERIESDNVAASPKHYSSPIQHKKRITSSSSSNTNAKQQEEHLSPTCDVQTKTSSTTSLQQSAESCKVFCLIHPQQRLSSVLLTPKDSKQQQQAFLLKETGTTKEAFALCVPLFV